MYGLKIPDIFNLPKAPTPGRVRLFRTRLSDAVRGRNDDKCNGIERMLALFAAFSAAWFVFFEVFPPNDGFGILMAKKPFWAAVFGILVILHAVAWGRDSCKMRQTACLLHAVVWGTWTLLAATTIPPSMATPLLAGLFVMGFYEAVRIKLRQND